MYCVPEPGLMLKLGLAGPGFDPADPPLLEGEAAYLDRLGLWLPGERRRAPVELFEPEQAIIA